MHILLADDNEANCLVARTILEREGHRVATARNGDEAVNLTKCAAFDLIILDILMPVMDGPSALNRIRQGNSQNRNVPTYALMAYGDTEVRRRYSLAGFDAILSKPLQAGDLEDAVLRHQNRDEATPTNTLKTPSLKPLPVLNDAKIFQLITCDRPSELEEIQSRFWTSIQGQCELIESALPGAIEGNGKNLSEFRRATHAIKSASETIGLAQISDIARRLRNAPSPDIPGLVHALIDALSEGRPALEQALSGPWQLNAPVQMGRED